MTTVGDFFVVMDRSGQTPAFHYKLRELRAAALDIFSTSNGRQFAAIGNGLDGIVIFDLNSLSDKPTELKFDAKGVSTALAPAWFEAEDGRIFIGSVNYHGKLFVFDLSHPTAPLTFPDFEANREPRWFKDQQGNVFLSIISKQGALHVIEVLPLNSQSIKLVWLTFSQ